MHSYELMIIFMPSVDPTDQKGITTMVNKLLGDTKQEKQEITVIGKKPLAYPIRKEQEGVYVLVQLTGAPVKTGDIQRRVKLMPEVLRYLLTTAVE